MRAELSAWMLQQADVDEQAGKDPGACDRVRQLVELHEIAHECPHYDSTGRAGTGSVGDFFGDACLTLRLIGELLYADRAGYLDSWRATIDFTR